MLLLNGRCGSDCGVGNFMCHEPKGSSVNDYIIVSHDLYDLFKIFDVCPPMGFTDHCALYTI